jgi:hypothetical protein
VLDSAGVTHESIFRLLRTHQRAPGGRSSLTESGLESVPETEETKPSRPRSLMSEMLVPPRPSMLCRPARLVQAVTRSRLLQVLGVMMAVVELQRSLLLLLLPLLLLPKPRLDLSSPLASTAGSRGCLCLPR